MNTPQPTRYQRQTEAEFEHEKTKRIKALCGALQHTVELTAHDPYLKKPSAVIMEHLNTTMGSYWQGPFSEDGSGWVTYTPEAE